MSARVLMVDDEEVLVWTTARQMARERPDLAFQGFVDPEQALAQLRRESPDLLITDVRMSKMNGLELLLAARELAPQLPVIVVTAYGSPEVRTQVQQAGSVEYLEKPFTFPQLLAAVDQALRKPSGFSGAIQLPMLPDLIQMYALSRMTGALQIRRGGEQSALWFDQGEVVHAACGVLTGDEAFYHLLGWEGGTFASQPDATAPARTIQAGWQALLVEGCRRLDEARRAPTGTLAVQAHALWERLRAHMDKAAEPVVAAALDGSAAITLHGAADAEAWGQALGALAAQAAGLGGQATRGAAELVAFDRGLALAWDASRGLVLGAAETLSGPTGTNRFRSNAARWQEAFNAWAAGEGQ